MARRPARPCMFVTHNVREAVRLGDRVVLLTSRPGGSPQSTPSTSTARAASTRPRSRRSRRRSPTGCARRCGRHGRWTADVVALRASTRLAASSSRAAGRHRARRIWAATWPKLLAVAIVHRARGRSSCGRGWKPEYVLPSPFTVFERFWRGLGDAAAAAARTTLQRGVNGFAIALRHRRRRRSRGRARPRSCAPAIGSMITGLQTMPSIAWFPLAIVLFELERGRDPVRRRPRRGAVDRQRPHQRRRQHPADPAAGRARARRARARRRCATSCSRPRCRRSSAASSRAGRSPGAACWPASCIVQFPGKHVARPASSNCAATFSRLHRRCTRR